MSESELISDGFIIDDDGYVNVWVDGSCLRNGSPNAQAGYGVFFNFGHYMYVYVTLPLLLFIFLTK